MFSFEHPLFNTFVTSPYTRKKSGYSFISITMQCFTQKSFLPYFLASEATHQSLVRSSHRRCFVRKVFLEILENSQENTCARVSFLIKLQASACNFIKKETLAQLFCCEFCKIYKDTFFTEHLRTTASVQSGGKWSGTILSVSFRLVDPKKKLAK